LKKQREKNCKKIMLKEAEKKEKFEKKKVFIWDLLAAGLS
jgi:hypothetical protein